MIDVSPTIFAYPGCHFYSILSQGVLCFISSPSKRSLHQLFSQPRRYHAGSGLAKNYTRGTTHTTLRNSSTWRLTRRFCLSRASPDNIACPCILASISFLKHPPLFALDTSNLFFIGCHPLLIQKPVATYQPAFDASAARSYEIHRIEGF